MTSKPPSDVDVNITLTYSDLMSGSAQAGTEKTKGLVPTGGKYGLLRPVSGAAKIIKGRLTIGLSPGTSGSTLLPKPHLISSRTYDD
jgi:hypothetical protein